MKIFDLIENIYVKPFAKKIENGKGWITDEYVLKKFLKAYPEFKNDEYPFFESIEFEKWLIDTLSEHVDVRDASDPMFDL
jgi:hypothetical protein